MDHAFCWEQFFHDRLQAGSSRIYAEALAVLERDLLPIVLRHTGGNKLRAARLLGITRANLRNKLRSHGLARPAVQSAEEITLPLVPALSQSGQDATDTPQAPDG